MPDTPSSNALPAGCADPVFGPTTTLPGLSAPFSLFRDQLGMAHVKTSNENDAFFAQGFVTAADRLFQMDVARRRALGRLSELLGDKFVNEDILIRKMGVPESCVADWLHTRQISDAERMILSYTAGVNAFITWGRTNTWSVEYSELNVEPEEWKPEDCIAASKARHALLGVFQNKLFRAKLAASLPREIFEKLCDAPRKETGSTILSSGTDGSSSGPEAPAWFATLDSVPEFSDAIQTALQSIIEVAGTEPAPGGSNIWNLAGQHTSVGNLLSGDPHRETECPNMYYPIHISSPDWNVTGLTFSGVPGFPHFGHNAHVGWGITHGMAGKEDLYLEKIEGGGETWVGVDGPKPLKKVVQVLKVRGGKDVQLEILSTENGPLLTAPVPSRDGTHFAISIKNTSTFRPNSQLACHYALLRATSVKEALDSMKGWVEPAGNFTVADKESIGYVNRGCYPLRNPANHWLPVPGWLDEYKWRGEIPFEELPRIEKPASGKIIHANNPIVGRGYKHGLLSIDYSMTWRVDQIRGTIEERLEGGKWGVEDTRMLHSDVYSRPAEVLCGLIGEVEGVAETWRQKMQVWDFRLNKESVEAYVYQVWRRRLVASLFEAGEKLAPVLEGSNGFDVNSKLTKESVVENGNIWNSIVFLAEQNDTCVLGAGETWNDRATRTFQQTIDMLSAEHGSNWPTWGDVHVLQAKHPLTGKIDGFLGSGALDGRRVGMGGDGDTVQAAPGYTSVLALSVCRYALTPSNWNESKWIIPFGVSGHRASPHFEDQLAYYEKHEMVDWVYDWEGLERGAGGRWEFVPAG